MGSLTVFSNSIIYLDTNALIYSVEKKEPYATLLRPVWDASTRGLAHIVGSELLIVETLSGPLKQQGTALVRVYEMLLATGELELKPITAAVLRRAADMRASYGLKTPDAIHAATALIERASTFLTNDVDFRRVSNLPLQVLDEIIAS